MPELQTDILKNLFRISTTEVSNQYQVMLNDLETEIQTYRTMQMDDAAIYKALLSDFENEAGVFGRFGGGIERTMDGLIVRTTQSEQVANNPVEQKYDWILDPTVEKHCDDCVEREGMGALTMLEWSSMGIPGSGVTECGDYCKCLLEVSVEPN
jgi:hypothetical protein